MTKEWQTMLSKLYIPDMPKIKNTNHKKYGIIK